MNRLKQGKASRGNVSCWYMKTYWICVSSRTNGYPITALRFTSLIFGNPFVFAIPHLLAIYYVFPYIISYFRRKTEIILFHPSECYRPFLMAVEFIDRLLPWHPSFLTIHLLPALAMRSPRRLYQSLRCLWYSLYFRNELDDSYSKSPSPPLNDQRAVECTLIIGVQSINFHRQRFERSLPSKLVNHFRQEQIGYLCGG